MADDGGEGADDGAADDGGYFRSASARRSVLGRAGLVVGTLVLVTVGVQGLFPQLTDPGWVRATVAGFGPFAPLAFVCLQTAQVILAPIPGQMLAGVGGYLFGPLRGTVYSMAGVLLGSAAVFVVSRAYGRPYVERVLDTATVDRWDGVVDRVGVPGLFVLFLLPTFPDDLLCAVAGCTDIRLRRFLTLVLVGRTPSFLAVAYAGGELSDGRLVGAVAVVSLLCLVSGLVYVTRHRIVETLGPTG